MQQSMIEPPPPPYSSAMGRPGMPLAASFCQTASSQRPSLSRSAAPGATTASAIAFTLAWRACCSSVKVKSMASLLRSVQADGDDGRADRGSSSGTGEDQDRDSGHLRSVATTQSDPLGPPGNDSHSPCCDE